MENIADVEWRKTIIEVRAEDARGTVPIDVLPARVDAAAIQQIVRVGENLGIGIGSKEAQPRTEAFFDLGLQTVVVAGAFGGRIAGAVAEIRERNQRICRRSLPGDGGRIVAAGENLQMSRKRSHISGLHSDGWGELILNREVATHVVGRFIVKLNAAQLQPAGIND